MSERLTRWMNGYLTAWRTNRPEDIEALFTEDAVYDPQAKSGVWEGRDAIVEQWRGIADPPDTWEFEWAPLVETEDVAVITGRTRYLEDPPNTYRNLWVIRFAEDDRCREFTEWWVKQRQ